MFFTNPKTALVVSYLYVFASGLLGNLLLSTYMGLDEWWVNIVEIVPAFALYRGLYIMGLYAFVGAYTGSGGLTFSQFNSDGNGELPFLSNLPQRSVWDSAPCAEDLERAGLGVVFIILLVEAVLFLVLAWYLEQVLPTGTGVRRHPLFFLPKRWRHRCRGKSRTTQVTTPLCHAGEAAALAVIQSRGRSLCR